jgi:GNAT superfamily N-acetyltransferase
MTPEWIELFATMWSELVSDGLYSQEEIDAMVDPERHEQTWIPKGPVEVVAELGGFVEGALVGSVDVWRRDQTAVMEQLAVHPLHRNHGYGRKLVRAAVAVARRTGFPTVEVFAIEREPKAVAFWQHVLGVPPSMVGDVTLLDTHLPAKGWRLATATLSV